MSRPKDTDDDAGPGDVGDVASAALPASVQAGPMNHAIVRVARLHRMLAAQLLRRVGLHPAQELVMMQLWDHGPQRQVDLVRMLGSDAATMTRTIQRLEHAGFVRRKPSFTDKRATIIEATPASQAVRRQIEDIWAELETATAAGLTSDQQAEALKVLQLIEDSLARAASD